MEQLGLQIGAGLVILPVKFRMGGLFAWSILSHEVGGHSILDSCPEVIEEWSSAIKTQIDLILEGETYGRGMLDADYWANPSRVEELASDILGVLISGPAFGIGSIGYHRGVNKGKLERSTASRSTHPPHLLRAIAIAKVIELLNLDPPSEYIKLITQEIEKDSGSIEFLNPLDPLGGKPTLVPFDFAKNVVKHVATIIMTIPLKFFDNKSLMELIKWEERDDAIVFSIQQSLQKQEQTRLPHLSGIDYLARYIVPAAILAATEANSNIPSIFEKMKEYLREAHERHEAHGKRDPE